MTPEEWVEDRVDELVGQLAGVAPAEIEPWLAMVLLDVVGGIHALSECGLLADGVAERALERLGPHYEESSEIASVSVQSSLHGFASTSGTALLISDDDEPPPPPPPHELRRVVAVGETIGLVEDEPLLVTAVELWADVVVVHALRGVGDLHRRRRLDSHRRMREFFEAQERGEIPADAMADFGPPWPDRPLEAETFHLTDDVGTGYHFSSGSTVDEHELFRMQCVFMPGVPEGATELVLEAGEPERVTARVVLPLT